MVVKGETYLVEESSYQTSTASFIKNTVIASFTQLKALRTTIASFTQPKALRTAEIKTYLTREIKTYSTTNPDK